MAQLFESEDKNVLEKGENFVSEKIVKFHEEHFWLETFKKPIIDDSGEDYLYSAINLGQCDNKRVYDKWEIVEDNESESLQKLIK